MPNETSSPVAALLPLDQVEILPDPVGVQGFQSPFLLPVLARHDAAKGRKAFVLSLGSSCLPVSVGSERGLTVARILGESLSQYADCLGPTVSPEMWQKGLAVLKSEGVDILILRRVREDSATEQALKASSFYRCEPVQAPYIDLASLEHHRPKALREAGRLRRRLEAESFCTFSLETGKAELAPLIEQAFFWKRDWARDKGLPSRFISEAHYGESLKALFTLPQAWIGVLGIHSEPVAVEAGFVLGNRFYAFLSAYRADCRDKGVGTIVMGEMLRALAVQGIQIYDQLAPADPYKLLWSKERAELCDVVIPLSRLGFLRAWLLDQKLVPLARHTIRRLPESIRVPVLKLIGRR